MPTSHCESLAFKAAVSGSQSDMADAIRQGCDLEARDRAGECLSTLCAFYGNAGALRALLEAGSNPNARNARKRMTPAHRAASYGHIPCLEVLAEFGADFEALDADRSTPAECAQRMGRHAAAEFIQGRARSISERSALNRSVAGADGIRQDFRL